MIKIPESVVYDVAPTKVAAQEAYKVPINCT